MATQPSGSGLTEAELLVFAQKVEDWSTGLTPREQALLTAILERASGAEGADVHGYGGDIASGQASGKRQWKPVQFNLGLDSVSPLLFQLSIINNLIAQRKP